MTLEFMFDRDYSMKHVKFTGLTGREYVTSAKDSLNLLKVRNPAADFKEEVKKGHYNSLSDEDFKKALGAVKCVSALWHYPDDPTGSKTQYDMNVLTLLANAIVIISRQNAMLRQFGAEEIHFP